MMIRMLHDITEIVFMVPRKYCLFIGEELVDVGHESMCFIGVLTWDIYFFAPDVKRNLITPGVVGDFGVIELSQIDDFVV